MGEQGGPELGQVVADRYRVRGTTVVAPAYVDVRVFDQEVEVELALWWMNPSLFGDPARREAVADAAHDARTVRHAHLRRVFDSGTADGGAYVVSQVGSPDAITLILGSGRSAGWDQILRYASAMGEALEAAHASGLVHGYLVPVDLVEVAGQLKVSGAGLYGRLDPGAVCERWRAAGTSRYLAPEVARGAGEIGPPADVYSMAAILLEVATGSARPELEETLALVAGDQEPLARVLSQALAPEPGRRPQRPRDLLDLVRRAANGESLGPAPREPVSDARGDRPGAKEADRGASIPPVGRAAGKATPAGTPASRSPAAGEAPASAAAASPAGGPAAATDPAGPLSVLSPSALSSAVSFGPPRRDSDPFGGDDDLGGQTVEESSPLFLHPSAAPSSPLFGPNAPTVMGRRSPRGRPPPRVASSSRSSASAETVIGPGPSRGSEVSAAPPMPEGMGPAEPAAALPPGGPASASLDTGPATVNPAGGAPPSARPAPPAEGPSAAAPDPSAHASGSALKVPLSSRKPPAVDGAKTPTPVLAAIDRPDMQPVLRPLSSLKPPAAAPGSLGNYAPPRPADRASSAASGPGRTLWIGLILAALVVVGGAVALVLVLARGGSHHAHEPPPPPAGAAGAGSAAVAVTPPPRPPSPCPPGMGLVSGSLLDLSASPFCIDRYEAPGPGQPPRVGVTVEEARAACQARSARLCRPDEWEDACRGPDHSSFPYGAAYVARKCNTRGHELSAIGSFPECVSAAGAFDMSGNAAEWDAEGELRGASATDGERGRCSEKASPERASARQSLADVGFRCCADPRPGSQSPAALAPATPSR